MFFTLVPALTGFEEPLTGRSLITITVSPSFNSFPFESRILDKNTILVSGIFSIDKNQKLKVTQNYIILPFGKWIMHDRINSHNGNILITADGIKISE